MHKSEKSFYESYIETIGKGLNEKNALAHYKYLDGCVELYDAYVKEISKIKDCKKIHRSTIKTKVFKIFFNSSLIYFNELRNNIVLSNYTSSYCILRIIIENYIIMTFLYYNANVFSRKYYNFSNVLLSKIANKYPESISTEIRDKTNRNYKTIKKEIEADYNKLSKSQKSNFGINATDLINNNYGWISTFLLKRPSLELIAIKSNLEEEIKEWDDLCSFVHSNEVFIKFQQLEPNFSVDLKIFDMYCNYIVKYINLYIKIYKINKEDEKNIQNTIDSISIQLDECGEIYKIKKDN